MPGFYQPGAYDLAGFTVGVVEKDKVWDGSRIKAGDVLLGLLSSGLHSNGFSLARHVLFEQRSWTVDTFLPEVGRTLGEELLTPTRIYVKNILALRDRFAQQPVIKGAAHITGGGIIENVPRMLPDGLGAAVRRDSWPVSPVFRLIQGDQNAAADISEEEMHRVFNMGIGFVIIVEAAVAGDVSAALEDMGEEVFMIGEVRPGRGITFIGK